MRVLQRDGLVVEQVLERGFHAHQEFINVNVFSQSLNDGFRLACAVTAVFMALRYRGKK